MIRLFVALLVPGEIRNEIIRIRDEAIDNPEDYNWVTEDKLHITLKFIGEVEEGLVNKISEELDFVKNYRSFKCVISKFGFFFRSREPKILWADFNTDDSIIKLVKELNYRLEKFNIEPERRKFKPHLTLLRIKKNPGEDFIHKFNNHSFPALNFKADIITLMQSTLNRTGAQYKEIKKYELS